MSRWLPFFLILFSFAGFAQAADLSSRHAPEPAYPPPPLFTWSGISLGGEIGYAWGESNFNLPATSGLSRGSSPEGVVGGAHIGYNYQLNRLVAGMEADVDGTSVSASGIDPVTGATVGSRIPVEGSVRGRLGFAWDRALFYATGGAAFADLEHSYAGGLVPLYATSASRVGWTVGGGVEYAVTNNWSVRSEYRYTDFGRTIDVPSPAVSIAHHDTEHAVRVGFSYKFEMYAPPPPVAAKY